MAPDNEELAMHILNDTSNFLLCGEGYPHNMSIS